MSIVAKLKQYVPKTPKQWVVAGLGTTAAALTVDYAVRKDGSIVMRLWHGLHHGGGHHPHSAAKHHGKHGKHGAHPVAPNPGGVASPAASPMMYGGPQMGGQTSVFVEPSLANPFFYEFRNYGYDHSHFGGQSHADHYQHMPQNPMGAASHGAPSQSHPHHVGAPDGEPRAPKQSRAKIPPPGAYGIVSGTPQAPGIVAAGDFNEAPCGPGLFYDEQQQRCVPVPSTPPYGWQPR